MNEYLIGADDPAAYAPEDYRHVHNAGQQGAYWVLNILHTEDPTLPGDALIGGWDREGRPVTVIDTAAFELIRPLGNNAPRPLYDQDGNVTGQTRGGDATKALTYHGFAGFGLRRVQSLRQLGVDEEHPYPATNSPFAIGVRHKYFGGNANPARDGWGWRAEIVGPADARDPSARAIGIYNDPEATDYWYTTGAFVEGPSEWQVDEQGDPLQVWGTEYNPGLLGSPQPVPIDVHHAVLLGAAQEGYATLPGGDPDNFVNFLFWEGTQGEGAWQETGSTVTGIAGAGVYNVDDTAPFDAMPADTPLRIGGEDTLFDRVHAAGAPGIIVVDDHNAAAVGEMIWAQI